MTLLELGQVEKGDILRSPIGNEMKVIYTRTVKDAAGRLITVKAIFMGGTTVTRKNCEHWEVVDK